ncbi:MAG: YchF/TatD family DNA exonuclease [Xanthomonadaceae bacterium]|nr:YchF/TatD family DNA exonuclease [Rhodospirillaceae bacterium]NIA18061.1 YchF/TatD family DNA exonuclease [Xanthomonadaceae bacterium]
MLIDIHTHTNFKDFKNDYKKVIKRALKNNTWLINVGSQISTSERAVKIANEYQEGVYAIIGLHPIHLEDFYVNEGDIQFKSRKENFDYNSYKKLAKNKKVVAIGEIGLDYFHIKDRVIGKISDEQIKKTKEKQKEIFIKQFELAQELNLPVMIHCREAHQDLIKILQKLKIDYPKARGVIHCFNQDLSTAKKYFNLGFLISFTGIITFAKGFDWIKDIPENRFMVETDAPYLTPNPHRGERNEPIYVKYIVRKIAEIRNTSFENIAKITTQNAKNFFQI